MNFEIIRFGSLRLFAIVGTGSSSFYSHSRRYIDVKGSLRNAVLKKGNMTML
jgi:hypothetical protein